MDTAFEEVNRLCDQWERAAPLPPDARHLLHKLVKRLVMQAAQVCVDRANVGAFVMAQSEARKCADSIRHHLLCGESEYVCYSCDGAGCGKCRDGIRLSRPIADVAQCDFGDPEADELERME